MAAVAPAAAAASRPSRKGKKASEAPTVPAVGGGGDRTARPPPGRRTPPLPFFISCPGPPPQRKTPPVSRRRRLTFPERTLRASLSYDGAMTASKKVDATSLAVSPFTARLHPMTPPSAETG